MPREESHEGLVLKAIDYKDRQKILTILTPDRGLLSLIIKGITRKKSHLIALATPLIHAEYQLRPQRSALYTFLDGTLLATHQSLRTSLPHLKAAGTILRALLRTQLPGNPSPVLFQLTLAYLRHLSTTADPAPLLSSYLLKLLKHEGHPLPPDSDELANARDFRVLKNYAVSEGHSEQIYEYLMRKTDCERGDSNPQEVSFTTTSR